jgi:hypothetical protein
MFALISTDELAEMNQIMVKQLKNRYNDTASNRKFLLGINRAKMKVFDIKTTQPTNLITISTVPPKDKKTKTDDWKF